MSDETFMEKMLGLPWRMPLARSGVGLRRLWGRVVPGARAAMEDAEGCSELADEPGGVPGCTEDPVALSRPVPLRDIQKLQEYAEHVGGRYPGAAALMRRVASALYAARGAGSGTPTEGEK
jgi:hypothetical protein